MKTSKTIRGGILKECGLVPREGKFGALTQFWVKNNVKKNKNLCSGKLTNLNIIVSFFYYAFSTVMPYLNIIVFSDFFFDHCFYSEMLPKSKTNVLLGTGIAFNLEVVFLFLNTSISTFIITEEIIVYLK